MAVRVRLSGQNMCLDGGTVDTRSKDSQVDSNPVAETKEEAIEAVKNRETHYKGWDCWASEFTIDGYIIRVYDEMSYNRAEKIDKIF